MGMQNKLTAVGLYLAAIFLLYGRTEVFPTNLYKSQKAELSAEKRKPKAARVLKYCLSSSNHSSYERFC